MSEQINENKIDVQRKSMSYQELSQKKYTECGRVPIRSSNREPFRVGVANESVKFLKRLNAIADEIGFGEMTEQDTLRVRLYARTCKNGLDEGRGGGRGTGRAAVVTRCEVGLADAMRRTAAPT